MNNKRPAHIYEIPVELLPGVFKYVDLLSMLKYASASKTACEQMKYACHDKFYLRLECTSRKREIIISEKIKKEYLGDSFRLDVEELRWHKPKEISILLKSMDAPDLLHPPTKKLSLIINNQLLQASYCKVLKHLTVRFNDENRGLQTVLCHIRDIFQPKLHAAEFWLISNPEIFDILEIIRSQGLSVHKFVRSIPVADPNLSSQIGELREVRANIIAVAEANTVNQQTPFTQEFMLKYFVDNAPIPNLNYSEFLKWMEKCNYIRLGESKWTNKALHKMLFYWMKQRNYQLETFRLSRPNGLDVSLIASDSEYEVNSILLDAETVSKIDEQIIPGQCYRCRRTSDAASFLIYQTKEELVVERELPVVPSSVFPNYIYNYSYEKENFFMFPFSKFR